MPDKIKLMLCFGLSGFISSTAVAVFFWWWLGPENLDRNIKLVLGLEGRSNLLVFPILGTMLPMAWTFKFKAREFGIKQGIAISFYSFMSFCVCLAIYNSIYSHTLFIAGLNSYLIFGFISFGWALLIIGAATGKFFEYYVSKSAI